MREIVLDTETTGLEPSQGHRIVEIAAIELINGQPTGKSFHRYLNPERKMPKKAFEIHGLSADFLSDKPKFVEIAVEISEFLQDSPLVIHNAPFDMKFLNAELKAAGRRVLPTSRAVDTLAMARRMFPGAPVSLDALCQRFKVDTSSREKHAALVDCELLSAVYFHLNHENSSTLPKPRRQSRGEIKPPPSKTESPPKTPSRQSRTTVISIALLLVGTYLLWLLVW